MPMKRALSAFAIGAILTALLASVAFALSGTPLEPIGRVAFWQNELLQSLTPKFNVGSVEQPMYEGTPLNFLAFLLSVPLGVVVYAAGAYVLLGRRDRRGELAA